MQPYFANFACSVDVVRLCDRTSYRVTITRYDGAYRKDYAFIGGQDVWTYTPIKAPACLGWFLNLCAI